MNRYPSYACFNSGNGSLSFSRLLPLLVFCIACSIVMVSCNQSSTKTVSMTPNNEVYYTCSMHPQVHEDHPGKCPICQMDLIAVPKTSLKSTNEVHLNEEQIRLGNIMIDTIAGGNIGNRLVLPGTLNFNQQKLSSISTRVDGRLEKLYVKKTGDYVRKGDPLFDLYSEQLNNGKQEYIAALKQQNAFGNSLINYGALVESAKGKLVLWGMNSEQIAGLSQSPSLSTVTTFYSPESGYVTALNAQEGSFNAEGTAIMQLADLSTLWAEGQVYTTQLSLVSRNSDVTIQIPGRGNQIIKGVLEFENPEINPATRIGLVRVTIPNANHELSPGMPVYIIAAGKQHHSIILPAEAVLLNKSGAVAWIQTRPGTYTARMVTVGIMNDNSVEILSGLKPGDVVVTSGAYLINSEYIFENGANPMGAMDMGKQ